MSKISSPTFYSKRIIDGKEFLFISKSRLIFKVLMIFVFIFAYVFVDLIFKTGTNIPISLILGIFFKTFLLLGFLLIIASLPFSENIMISSEDITFIRFFFKKIISKKSFIKNDFTLTVLPGYNKQTKQNFFRLVLQSDNKDIFLINIMAYNDSRVIKNVKMFQNIGLTIDDIVTDAYETDVD